MSSAELKRRRLATVENTVEASKRLAAYTAVDRHVLPQHKVDFVFESLDVLRTLPMIATILMSTHLLDNRHRVRSAALGHGRESITVRD